MKTHWTLKLMLIGFRTTTRPADYGFNPYKDQEEAWEVVLSILQDSVQLRVQFSSCLLSVHPANCTAAISTIFSET